MTVHNTQQILLVEDDIRLSSLISDFLTQNGFVVDVISNGDKAVTHIINNKPDLVILDVMLPGIDGFKVCRSVRPKYSGPILFLTAKATDFDQVLGLEMGADDYVVKPIEPRVLLARVNALLRRYKPSAIQSDETVTQFGNLTIKHSARYVELAGMPITLTSHEFDMLSVLASKAGDVLSRDFLSKTLLGREYDGVDRSVDVRISRLRKKLGDNADTPFRIKTIWGQGYLFVPDAWS